MANEFAAFNLVISPDGQWVAWDSSASGQREIYVRTFGNVEDRQWLVSVGGRRDPV